MRNLLLGLALITYCLGLVYLSLPTPPVPDLSTLRSVEPGDTWQNPTQKAFYSDWTRETVMAYYQQNYVVQIVQFRFPTLRLNYRPEDTAVYVRPHIDSYWLEEVIHPLRESIFVNGWTPRLAPINAGKTPEELNKIKIVIGDQNFQSKYTIRWFESPLWARLLVWTAIFPLAWLTFSQLFRNLTAIRRAL